MRVSSEGDKPRLVIVSLYSYPLFRPEFESPFGGSEVRVSLIAKGLAALGCFDVEVVVFDHNQPSAEFIDGVTVRAWPGTTCPIPTREPAGLPAAWAATHERLQKVGRTNFLKSAIYRWGRWVRRKLAAETISAHIGPHAVLERSVSFFRELDADMYMMPGNSMVSAELATWCRNHGRPFVMLAGSDGDFHPDFFNSPNSVGIYGLPGFVMSATIEAAAGHIVQNERQAQLLKASWNREATIVRNPVDLTIDYPKVENARDILWIGKSDWIKRPGLFLDLAERLPNLSFRMIMAFSNKEIWEATRSRARGLENVTLVDFVPFNEVEMHFAQAYLFVNTSVFEGFPNTFLQAGKYAIPVISLVVDPGMMLREKGCGVSCDDNSETLLSEVASFASDKGRYARASQAILDYVRSHHEKTLIARQYQEVLTRVLTASGRARDAGNRLRI